MGITRNTALWPFPRLFSVLLSSLDLNQPLCFRVALAGSLLEDAAFIVDVAKVVSDLDEPLSLEACDVRAVNRGVTALAVVALAVPAVKGEPDLLAGLGKVGFEVLSGDRGVVIDQVELVSECVGVFHGGVLPSFCCPIYHSKSDK